MSRLLFSWIFFYGILLTGVAVSALVFALSGRKLHGKEKWQKKIIDSLISLNIAGVALNVLVAVQWHVLYSSIL